MSVDGRCEGELPEKYREKGAGDNCCERGIEVDRGEQVIGKLFEQRKVCCNVSIIIIQFVCYMMCPYLVSGVCQQDCLFERGFPEADRKEGAARRLLL